MDDIDGWSEAVIDYIKEYESMHGSTRKTKQTSVSVPKWVYTSSRSG